jgi:hypothetical protein
MKKKRVREDEDEKICVRRDVCTREKKKRCVRGKEGEKCARCKHCCEQCMWSRRKRREGAAVLVQRCI